MSIEAKIAEAVYLVAINPETLARVQKDPELLLHHIVQLWPASTPEQINRALAIANELLISDLASFADEHRRNVQGVAQSALFGAIA
jgi:hypothetical protein